MTGTPDRSPQPPDGHIRPVLRMRWEQLTCLSWRCDPDQITATLPDGLQVDMHDGAAWVSLIPFMMRNIRAGGIRLPQGTFPETNVRTYVIGPDGQPGVHFTSLDIPHAAPTWAARTLFSLPYHRADMHLGTRHREGRPTIRYQCRRRTGQTLSDVTVAVGSEREPDPLDVFLTARWALYTGSRDGHLLKVQVRHAPWQIRQATLLHHHDQLVEAGGHRTGGRAPDHILHTEPVDVTVSRPARLPARR